MKLRFDFRSFVVCLVLLLSYAFSAHAGFFNGKTKFYTLKTEHFYIHFPQGLGPIAEEMRTLTEQVHNRMTQRLGWVPRHRTHIVLTDKSEASNGVATVLPDNYILLYIAMPTPDSTLDYYRNYYEYLFSHEYTHILHIDQTHRMASTARRAFGRILAPNGATPSWMREGMAVYEESLVDENFGRNHSDYTDMVLRASIYENRFPRIDQVAGLSSDFPAGLGPYLYGGKFFQWLAGVYGEDRMYQYQKEYASGLWLYSLNNKARRVYGKSFYKLWKEFQADLTKKYEAERAQINALGVTPLEDVIKTKDSQTNFVVHPQGKGFAYSNLSLDESPQITVSQSILPEKLNKKLFKRRKVFGQMSFSQTGRYLAFSSLAGVEKKASLAEVYYADLKSQHLYRVVDASAAGKSMRVSDPDFSPADGGERWLVMVRNYQNTDQLYVFDLLDRHGYTITAAPAKTQFSNPRFSPDGSKIVVSRKDPATGNRDIVIYSSLGQELGQITSDPKADNYPIFSNDGSKIYFSSSRTGVFNIFQYDLKTDALSQLTNVLTGVFQPIPSPQGDEIYVQSYSPDRNFIQKFKINSNPRFLTVAPILGEASRSLAQAIPTLSYRQSLTALPSFDQGVAFSSSLAPEFLVKEDSAFDLKNFARTDEPIPDTNPVPENEPLPDSPPTTEPDSVPVLPVQTDNHTPQTAPKQKTLSRKGVQRKAKRDVAQTEVQDHPSAYKSALQNNDHPVAFNFQNPEGAKKYSALPHILRPGYIVPNVLIYENAALMSAQIGRFDPLYRHSWTAFMDYRTDANFVGGGGTYIYSRYDPTFYVGALRYVVDWGTVTTLVDSGRFFEERWQAYTGMGYNKGRHGINLSYFYEHRGALSQIAGLNLVNMKPYAGVKLQYTLADYKKFPKSISQEDGYYVKLGLDVTDEALLSDAVNEEVVATADARYYLEMPWSQHHVLALRVGGGWKWGDNQQFGTFRLGGPFGEGTGAAKYSSRIFPLRGLAGISYSGDRAVMFSAEYRLPLFLHINRGIGTWPVFMDKLYLNFFSDGGDIQDEDDTVNDLFDRLLVSVGAEFRGDFVVGYGLPLTGRLGYGIILTNRDRLGTLTDAITGASVKNGSFYLQVGTSF